MTRWNLSIPEETDRAVRTFLARNGRQEGRPVPVRRQSRARRVLDLTVRQIKHRNARYDQRELLDLIDEEVDTARPGRS